MAFFQFFQSLCQCVCVNFGALLFDIEFIDFLGIYIEFINHLASESRTASNLSGNNTFNNNNNNNLGLGSTHFFTVRNR